jgi:DNA-binding FadR family transcriptional regulator
VTVCREIEAQMQQALRRDDFDCEWSPIGGNRASERVAEQIRRSFFAGMQPGDWIGTEASLAARFGVSRLTMRDAVRKLETCGMVEVKVGVGGGLRVAHAAPERVTEALAVQIHLNGLRENELAEATSGIAPTVARLAATRREEGHLLVLKQLLADQIRLAGEPAAFNRAAAEFHVALAEASGNGVLAAVVRALSIPRDLAGVTDGEIDGVIAATIAAHEELLSAVADHDETRAAALAADHVCSYMAGEVDATT